MYPKKYQESLSLTSGHTHGLGEASARVWFTNLLLPVSQVVYTVSIFKSVEILLKSRYRIEQLIS